MMFLLLIQGKAHAKQKTQPLRSPWWYFIIYFLIVVHRAEHFCHLSPPAAAANNIMKCIALPIGNSSRQTCGLCPFQLWCNCLLGTCFPSPTSNALRKQSPTYRDIPSLLYNRPWKKMLRIASEHELEICTVGWAGLNGQTRICGG